MLFLAPLVPAALTTGEVILGGLAIVGAVFLGDRAIDKMDEVGGSWDYKNGKASVYARKNTRDKNNSFIGNFFR